MVQLLKNKQNNKPKLVAQSQWKEFQEFVDQYNQAVRNQKPIIKKKFDVMGDIKKIL